MTAETKIPFFKQLIQRRVFQIVGIYLGAILALMEFTGMVVERYKISDGMVDLVLAGMSSFIPAVIILAWRHGAPGKDKWGNAEKIGVPTNAVLTLTLLVVISLNQNSNNPLPSANATIETPPQVSAEVTFESLFKRMGVFFFDPDPSLKDQSWLAYGLPYLISTHLSQEKTLVVASHYTDIENSMFWQVKRSGFQDGLNVPLSLARTVAIDNDLSFFVQGKLGKNETVYTLELQLFESRTNKMVATFQLQHNDPIELASLATEQLKQQSELIVVSSESINQIPLRDLTTTHLPALKLYIESMNQILFNNDYNAAVEGLKQTVLDDPNFALAYVQLSEFLARSGQLAESSEILKQLQPLSYKLTERNRFLLKAFGYALDQKVEQQNQVFRNWIELYPNDYVPRNRWAFSLIWKANDLAGAAVLFEESLVLNPSQNWIYTRLAKLYESLGNFEKAKQNYQLIIEKQPNDFSPLTNLGDIELRMGRFQEARKLYQKASVLRTDKVTPVLSLANLDLREGKLMDSEERFEEALIISQAPNQRGQILAQQINHYFELGQSQKAYAILLQYQEVSLQYLDPINNMFASIISKMHLYVHSGHALEAKEKLDHLTSTLDEKTLGLVDFGYLFYYVALGQTEQAEQSAIKVEELIRHNQMNHLHYLPLAAKGWIAEIKGEYSNAADYFELAISQLNSSAHIDINKGMLAGLYVSLVKNQRLMGATDRAIASAEEYLIQWPYHPDLNLEMATIRYQQADFKGAMTYLNKTLAMWQNSDPDFLPRKNALELQKQINEK